MLHPNSQARISHVTTLYKDTGNTFNLFRLNENTISVSFATLSIAQSVLCQSFLYWLVKVVLSMFPQNLERNHVIAFLSAHIVINHIYPMK